MVRRARGMRREQLGAIDNPNIWNVIDWVIGKQCDAARTGHLCNHKGCETEKVLSDELTALALGSPLPMAITTTKMHRWARVQVCSKARTQGQRCNHRACIEGQSYIDFILDIDLTPIKKKAA